MCSSCSFLCSLQPLHFIRFMQSAKQQKCWLEQHVSLSKHFYCCTGHVWYSEYHWCEVRANPFTSSPVFGLSLPACCRKFNTIACVQLGKAVMQNYFQKWHYKFNILTLKEKGKTESLYCWGCFCVSSGVCLLINCWWHVSENGSVPSSSNGW